MEIELIKALIASGPLGLLTAIAFWIAWKKDRQLQQLYERVVKWEQARAKRDHEMFKELNATLGALQEHTNGYEEEEESS